MESLSSTCHFQSESSVAIYTWLLGCVSYIVIFGSYWVTSSPWTSSMLWWKLFVTNWQQWHTASKAQPCGTSLSPLPVARAGHAVPPCWNEEGCQGTDANTVNQETSFLTSDTDGDFFLKFWCKMWPVCLVMTRLAGRDQRQTLRIFRLTNYSTAQVSPLPWWL